MFYCEATGQITQPGQKMIKVVMERRPQTYYGIVDGEEVPVGDGWEIVREAKAGAPIQEPTAIKPLIVNEGPNLNNTLDIYMMRAQREGRTVYITSHRRTNNRIHVLVILEITPLGVVLEVPPVGLAVGALDHTREHFLHWADLDNRASEKQKMKHVAALARFGKLVEDATAILKAEAKATA